MSFFKKLFGGKPSGAEHSAEPDTESVTPEESHEQPETQKSGNEEAQVQSASEPEATEQTNVEFETLRDDGVRALRMGETAYAEKCFRAALERKDDDHVKAFLAEACLRQNEGREAYNLTTDLLTRHAGDETLLQAQARAAGLCGDWEAMNAAGEALEKVNQDNPNALFYRAQAQRQMKNDELAVELLTRLLEKRPDTPEILQLRAQALFDMGKMAEAEKDVDRQIELHQASEDTLCLKGDLQRAAGHNDDAIRYYEQMKEQNPFNRTAVMRENEIYVGGGRYEEALKQLNEAIDLMPDFAEAYKERSKVKHLLHDEAGADADQKKALQMAPRNQSDEEGEYTNIENRLNEQARMRNPFGF